MVHQALCALQIHCQHTGSVFTNRVPSVETSVFADGMKVFERVQDEPDFDCGRGFRCGYGKMAVCTV
jgi:hypothetical protein